MRLCLVTDSLEPSGVGEHMLGLRTGFAGRLRLSVAFANAPTAGTLAWLARALGAEVLLFEPNDPPQPALRWWRRCRPQPASS